jgi:hypothetical protein
MASKSILNYGLASDLRVAHPFIIGTIMDDSRITRMAALSIWLTRSLPSHL